VREVKGGEKKGKLRRIQSPYSIANRTAQVEYSVLQALQFQEVSVRRVLPVGQA
jgi:hypothetical protein